MGGPYWNRPRQRYEVLVPAAPRLVDSLQSRAPRAKLAALNARWDTKREVVIPFRADAAPEMAAAQRVFSTIGQLHGLAL